MKMFRIIVTVVLLACVGSCSSLYRFMDTDFWAPDSGEDLSDGRKVPLPPTVEDFPSQDSDAGH